MRYTRKQIEAYFTRFVKTIGGKVATSYNDVGGYILDYNANYDGYQIAQIENIHGGQRLSFLGGQRFKAAQFVTIICFAIDAIDAKNKAK